MLVVGLAVVLAVWAFAEVAEEVVGGEALPFDEALLQLLRHPGELRRRELERTAPR